MISIGKALNKIGYEVMKNMNNLINKFLLAYNKLCHK